MHHGIMVIFHIYFFKSIFLKWIFLKLYLCAKIWVFLSQRAIIEAPDRARLPKTYMHHDIMVIFHIYFFKSIFFKWIFLELYLCAKIWVFLSQRAIIEAFDCARTPKTYTHHCIKEIFHIYLFKKHCLKWIFLEPYLYAKIWVFLSQRAIIEAKTDTHHCIMVIFHIYFFKVYFPNEFSLNCDFLLKYWYFLPMSEY